MRNESDLEYPSIGEFLKMKYETRAVGENDRDVILEIARTTWDGHDHLPKMFDEWLLPPGGDYG
jgi:hypothetical protein